MIPHIIHYCWFGSNPLPELAEQCIASWKEHMPDWEQKKWDDIASSPLYVRQAYELKQQGKDSSWFARMISATVVSIIGILSVQFYAERKTHIAQLKEMNIFPIAETSIKARLINFSPRMMVEVLHIKNK